MDNLIIGSHVSFTKDEQLLGSVKEALSYGANTFMFYTGAPQNTSRGLINNDLTEHAITLMKKHSIDINNVIVHAPYIVNLANKENHDFSINFLKQELDRCKQIGISKVVLHPGSHVGNGVKQGLKNIIDALNIILEEDKPSILLETMAGKGTELGVNFKEIKAIIDKVEKKDKLLVCLDTCHLNDSGYDLTNFNNILDEFDEIIGLSKLACIHINDSKNPLSSHKDRHENFGLGTIGFDNLTNIIYHKKLENIPKILETPYVGINNDSKERIYPPYKFEIEMIRNKKMNHNLLEDIRNFYK